MTKTGTEGGIEKPISGWSKVLLITGASAAVFLFYFFALVSIVLLLAVVSVEFGLTVAAARFGMARVMMAMLRRHLALLSIFFRSFYIRKGVEFRILLKPGDAPALFSILTGLCQRLGIALPDDVSLEMTCNAWVRMKGFRRGEGKTILGIGYDLLAGLSTAEAEAVLAHEMVHAKLVQRGFRWWLTGGLSRAAKLTNALAVQVGAFRQAKRSSQLAGVFLAVADRLTRLGARLVAAYSRQDEFDADRGAAGLCGPAPIRSSLVKLEAIAKITARLPWRERVAQLQMGDGFSHWLLAEIAAGGSFTPAEKSNDLFNKYSTHPLLGDRLAALASASEKPVQPSPPAIRLLADPDKIAAKLVLEIQRVAAAQEEMDSRQLKRWTRKNRNRSNLRPLQSLGAALVLISVMGAFFIWLAQGMSPELAVLAAGVVVIGVGCYRFGRYQDRVPLPVPDYAMLKEAWKSKNAPKNLAGAQKEIEADLQAHVGVGMKPKPKAAALAAEAYASLARCDYLRAHVAARLCRQIDKKSVEGLLALVVASSALHQSQQLVSTLRELRKATGIRSDSTIWGSAWALLLAGEWGQAEALLDQALEGNPDEVTIRILLALCQGRRGKLQSAILNARRACTPVAKNKEYAKLLVSLLLDGGYLQEAQQRLAGLESQAGGDTELMFSLIRLNLLLRRMEIADQWTEQFIQKSTGAQTFIQLGSVYEGARKGERAAEFYRKALEALSIPRPALGLAGWKRNFRTRKRPAAI
jgi:Zn-dependent protease with chaperone function